MEPKSILIVEDERITALEIESILEELGYKILGVLDTGKKVMEQMQYNVPDLVLMDIRLPGEMDGTEITQEISKYYSVPVVYLTAHSDPETLEKAKMTEPAGYLTKPVKREDLKATLEIALHNEN